MELLPKILRIIVVVVEMVVKTITFPLAIIYRFLINLCLVEYRDDSIVPINGHQTAKNSLPKIFEYYNQSGELIREKDIEVDAGKFFKNLVISFLDKQYIWSRIRQLILRTMIDSRSCIRLLNRKGLSHYFSLLAAKFIDENSKIAGKIGVLSMDVDGLKFANSLGYLVGNKLLGSMQEILHDSRLLALLKPLGVEIFSAVIGGDEFVTVIFSKNDLHTQMKAAFSLGENKEILLSGSLIQIVIGAIYALREEYVIVDLAAPDQYLSGSTDYQRQIIIKNINNYIADNNLLTSASLPVFVSFGIGDCVLDQEVLDLFMNQGEHTTRKYQLRCNVFAMILWEMHSRADNNLKPEKVQSKKQMIKKYPWMKNVLIRDLDQKIEWLEEQVRNLTEENEKLKKNNYPS